MNTTTLLSIFTCLLILLFSTAFESGTAQPAKSNSQDSFSLSKGKVVYISNCTGCHGASGEGAYGPNLCDKYWLHGSHYHGIHHVISHGVSKKGMPAFHGSLNRTQIRDVAHYVLLNLKGSSPANPKAAEGKKH